jgi:GNAT superfamily N-acetyltransferase
MAIPVRRATADDAAELSRLREVMFASFGPAPDRTLWWDAAVKELEDALADPGGPLQAFVVDADGGGGVSSLARDAITAGLSGAGGELASCAVGVIDRRLPSAYNPIGLSGYVLSVATDPRYRRRGYARAVVQATLEWFESRGILRVELHASTDAEAMYRSMGFLEPHGLALTRWSAVRSASSV